MKVSTNSWHYRLWKLGRESWSQPRDLCRYFWHIFLIKLFVPAVVAGVALFGIGALVWVVWGHPVWTLVVILTTVMAAGLVVGLVFLTGKLVEHQREKRRERRRNPLPAREKEPSVVWEFLKARKRKLCPLIIIVDDTVVDDLDGGAR